MDIHVCTRAVRSVSVSPFRSFLCTGHELSRVDVESPKAGVVFFFQIFLLETHVLSHPRTRTCTLRIRTSLSLPCALSLSDLLRLSFSLALPFCSFVQTCYSCTHRVYLLVSKHRDYASTYRPETSTGSSIASKHCTFGSANFPVVSVLAAR